MTGEILRAVLEDSCLWSRPAWYGDHQIVTAPPATGSAPNKELNFTMSGQIQTRANTLFLCTSVNVNVLDNTYPLSPSDGQSNFFPRNVRFPFILKRSATGAQFSFNSLGPNGPPASLFTTYPVSSVSLPTYIYLKAEETLDWELTFHVTNFLIPQNSGNLPFEGDLVQADILLQGIEYMMPTGAISGQAA